MKNKKKYDYKSAIVTIDDVSTLDIDDAVAVNKDNLGNYHVYVAIANVSKFLEEHPNIQIEAYKKATSIYKLGDMEPMIPTEYSENLISLLPHIKRDVVVGHIVVSKTGNVLDYEFFEDEIISNGAIPYQTINGFLDYSNKQDITLIDYINNIDEYCLKLDININTSLINSQAMEIEESIKNAIEVSDIIRNKRSKQGAILINEITPKYELDEHGEIISIKPHLRKKAEIMIEELMILANTAAANQLLKSDKLYFVRSHYKVNADNIEIAKEFLEEQTGYSFSAEEILADFPNYTERERKFFNITLLKFSDRAYYKTVKRDELGESILEGHQGIYGVGMQDGSASYIDTIYTHFTSPIRRYTDVVVHQLLRGLNVDVNDSMTQHFNTRKEFAKNAEKYSVQTKVKKFMDKYHDESLWSGEVVHTFGAPGREFAGIVKLNNGQTIFASNPREYYRTVIDGKKYQSTQRKFKKGNRIKIAKVPNARLWKQPKNKETDANIRMEFVQVNEIS